MAQSALRERAVALGAIGAVALASAALSAATASGSTAQPTVDAPTNGFAGPAAPARALDRDLEPGRSERLHRVECSAGDPTTSCWILEG